MDYHHSWILWNRTIHGYTLRTCLIGFILSFSLVYCQPYISPACHAAILTGPRTCVQLLPTMDFAPFLQGCTGYQSNTVSTSNWQSSLFNAVTTQQPSYLAELLNGLPTSVTSFSTLEHFIITSSSTLEHFKRSLETELCSRAFDCN